MSDLKPNVLRIDWRKQGNYYPTSDGFIVALVTRRSGYVGSWFELLRVLNGKLERFMVHSDGFIESLVDMSNVVVGWSYVDFQPKPLECNSEYALPQALNGYSIIACLSDISPIGSIEYHIVEVRKGKAYMFEISKGRTALMTFDYKILSYVRLAGLVEVVYSVVSPQMIGA